MQSRKFYYFGWLLVVVLIGADLRLTRLDAESFWFDEAWTWTIIRGSAREMFARLWSTDGQPPLYFFLVRFWASMFGTGEAALRFFSAAASIGAIPLMYVLGMKLGGRRAGYAAAVFTALSPFLVWYAKEARPSSFLFLLCLGSTALFFDLLRSPSRWKWALWAVLGAAVLYTDYIGAFFLLGTAAAARSLRRERAEFFREFLLASAGALVLFLPWLPVLLNYVRLAADDSGASPLSFPGVLSAFCGLAANPGSLLNGGGHMLSIPFYVVAVWYASRNRRPLETALLWLLLVPSGAGVLASFLWKPVFDAAAFSFLLIPLFALTALAVAQLPRPSSTILAVILALLFLPSLHHLQRSLHKEDWRGVTAFIDQRILPEEVVIVDPGYVAKGLEYYGQGSAWRKKIVRIQHGDSIAEPVKRDYAIREVLPNVNGVWLVYRYGRDRGWRKLIERNFEWRECLISRYVAAHHFVRR